MLTYTDYGPSPDVILIALTVTHGDRNFLYYGVLDDYQLDREGNLHRVVISGAFRQDMLKKGNPQKIPGEFFVVNCDSVQTADIDFHWKADDSGDSEKASG